MQLVPQEVGTEPADGSVVEEIAGLLDAAGLTHESDFPHRLYYTVDIVRRSYEADREDRKRSTRAAADIVSSETLSGMHAPAIDIDLPCRLLPSGTPGHFHLYIEKEMSWEKYSNLLKAMVEAGVVDKAYYEMALADKASFLRVPNKPKGAPRAKRMLDFGS